MKNKKECNIYSTGDDHSKDCYSPAEVSKCCGAKKTYNSLGECCFNCLKPFEPAELNLASQDWEERYESTLKRAILRVGDMSPASKYLHEYPNFRKQ